MKKTTKKPVKKVAVKKAPAKKPAQKTTKKISVTKKVTVTKKTTNADHRKQRGRTAPNRALSVTKKTTVSVTTKNKKPSKAKWVKKGPKKLGVAKVVKTIETPAQLLDLSKSIPPVSFPREQINPVDGSPKPWGSIAAPFKPVTCAAPVQQAKAIWVGPDTNSSTTAPAPVLPTCSMTTEFKSAIQSIDPSANWRPVMPR